MIRADIEPILFAIPAARQDNARHYGVHPYFTRRPANVVRAYIERYSREGDVVLDSFGGTGVTAIESFLLGRHAIHNDLNPFANFIARNIGDTTLQSVLPIREALGRVERECAAGLAEIESDEIVAKRWLDKLPLPENIRLPRTSDAEFFHDLFTTKQLAGLALLKASIDREHDAVVRDLLLLGWSASIAKLNKTFLSAKGRLASRGGSSIFSIYRYKLASQWIELPIWETFAGRVANVIAAKKEVLQSREYVEQQSSGTKTLDSSRDFRVLSTDAAADRPGAETRERRLYFYRPSVWRVHQLSRSFDFMESLARFPGVARCAGERSNRWRGTQSHGGSLQAVFGRKHPDFRVAAPSGSLVFHRFPALGRKLLRDHSGDR